MDFYDERFFIYERSFTDRIIDYSKQLFEDFNSFLKFDRKFLEDFLRASEENKKIQS